MDDNKGLIILEAFTFPDHWKVQAWLTGTGNDTKFTLTMAKATKTNKWGQEVSGYTVAALEPIDKKEAFFWKLKGPEGQKELEQEILDFADNIRYNT